MVPIDRSGPLESVVFQGGQIYPEGPGWFPSIDQAPLEASFSKGARSIQEAQDGSHRSIRPLGTEIPAKSRRVILINPPDGQNAAARQPAPPDAPAKTPFGTDANVMVEILE
jgi:hypothetical protein